MIEKGIHPDLILLEPDPHKKEIHISQARELIQKLDLSPFSSPFKAAIIDFAHLLNNYAQNCVLKTLEEPKGKSVLILISDQKESLLGTIRSRLQEVKFFPIAKIEIEKLLKKQGANDKQVSQISSFSLGRPGRALGFLRNSEELKEEERTRKEFVKIIKSDLKGRFDWAETLSKTPFRNNLESWLKYFREILIKGEFKSFEKIKKDIRELEKTIFLASNTNANKRLLLENLMLNL